jgi:translation elongation factor EF-G
MISRASIIGSDILTHGQGKTTTTERMLYYSGFTRRIGGMAIAVIDHSLVKPDMGI